HARRELLEDLRRHRLDHAAAKRHQAAGDIYVRRDAQLGAAVHGVDHAEHRHLGGAAAGRVFALADDAHLASGGVDELHARLAGKLRDHGSDLYLDVAQKDVVGLLAVVAGAG